jgi:hypothetical protein
MAFTAALAASLTPLHSGAMTHPFHRPIQRAYVSPLDIGNTPLTQ